MNKYVFLISSLICFNGISMDIETMDMVDIDNPISAGCPQVYYDVIIKMAINKILKDDSEKLFNYLAKGQSKEAKELIENNPHVINFQDSNGETALMIAARFGDLEMVKLLIEKGANPNIQSKNGRTAIMLAIIHDKWIICNFLKEISNMDIEDNDGNSARSILNK